MKKILCVVTSNNVKGATGIPTGFWLSELTHPLAKFAAAGISYDIASIKGGKPPIDGDSLDFNDAVNKKFWDDADFQRKLAKTIKIDDAKAENYDAIFFAGGHGVMWDFADKEATVQATKIVPFLLETALKNHGANHIAAENWSNHVEADGRLVTGQNPASAAGVGDEIVKLLRRN